ncbi:MAG: DNA-directed polymerase specialized sigma subunit, sigma24 [Gemmataceae bacterium]|nr:DNA-directed polymerase specialized sigma subunit, sigma24 [Gemmataceae bacterium]
MSQADAFQDLLTRARAGDPGAAEEIFRRYQGPVRRAIRFRVLGGGLRGPVTESDLCQSVFGSLFLRLAAGEYELARPEDLQHLLMRMAGHKHLDLVRQNAAARRDRRREDGGDPDRQPDPGGVANPERVAIGRELLAEARGRLTDGERALFDRRAVGGAWAEIAADLGEPEPALRQRLARAVRRVEADLGLGGGDD